MATKRKQRHSKPFPAFGLVFVVTALAGLAGIAVHWAGHLEILQTASPEPLRIAVNSLYGTAQIFMLNHAPGDKATPVLIDFVRLVAVFLTVYALRGILILTSRWIRPHIWRLKDHTVIVGAGVLADAMSRRDETGDRRTLRVVDGCASIGLAECRNTRVQTLQVMALDEDAFRLARMAKAAMIILADKNEMKNIENALTIAELMYAARVPRRVPCYVHTDRLFSGVVFRQLTLFQQYAQQVLIMPYDPCVTAARQALSSFPLDGEGLSVSDHRRPHLVISGFGGMGEALALQAARTGHYANGKKVRITAIDPLGEDLEQRLLYRYPALREVVDITFIPKPFEHAEAREALLACDAREELLTVALCLPEEERALEQALHLPREIADKSLRILVRVNSMEALDFFHDFRQGGDAGVAVNAGKFRAIGTLEDQCDLAVDDKNAWAWRIHEYYREKKRRDGQPMEAELDVPWERLPYDLRESNCQQADHMDVKLRAIGVTATPVSEDAPEAGEAFTFTAAEVELLAGMEHARWNADRLLAGWRPSPRGGKKDLVRRLTPYLVPYEELSEDIKEYDRDAVRNIAKLASAYGLRLQSKNRGVHTFSTYSACRGANLPHNKKSTHIFM